MPPKRSNPRRSTTKPKPQTPQRKTYTKHSDSTIHTAFSTYAIPSPRRRHTSKPTADDEEDEDDHGGHPSESRVIRILDVGRALTAANLPRPPAGFLDDYADSSDDSSDSDGDGGEGGGGVMNWRHFLALARTMRETVADQNDEEEEDVEMDDQEFIDNEEEEEVTVSKGKRKAKATPKAKAESMTTTAKVKGKRRKGVREVDAEEIDTAFALFTHSNAKNEGGEVRITLADLRRVARELKEDVDDAMLKMMIEEANGEGGAAGVAKGVGRGEFEGVMRRAGVFG